MAPRTSRTPPDEPSPTAKVPSVGHSFRSASTADPVPCGTWSSADSGIAPHLSP